MTVPDAAEQGPSAPDWLVIAHVRDEHAEFGEPAYPVAICPTCYALVTQNAWAKHEDWHRRRTSGLPTRYKGSARKAGSGEPS